MTTHPGMCDLCAHQGPVRSRMVAWRNPAFGPFENVDVCVDEAACRARIAARGETWPVLETGERAVRV